jgi:uncharacterized membrane protein YsdA (DUF1294 family)/cold shock CspA family protein
MRTQGKITHWNEQKGYGFITPAAGAKQIFVHIRAFNNRHQPPKLNQIVSFSLTTDNQGRPCAEKVTRAGEKQPRQAKRKRSILMILIALIFMAGVGLSVLFAGIHEYVLFVYLAVSLITYVVYAFDKSAAQSGDWRTSESTLHMLSLAGGWPGALIAQETLRHKSRKEDFRGVFWVTVIVNCGAFGWLVTTDGSAFLSSLIASAG